MLAGWRALTSTASSWPRNCSSSELSDSYDDPGAAGTHVVEPGSTPPSLPAVAVASLATLLALSLPILELTASSPRPAARSPSDPMPARGRQPTDLQYCARRGRLVAHPPLGAGPRPGRRGVGGPRLDGGE